MRTLFGTLGAVGASILLATVGRAPGETGSTASTDNPTAYTAVRLVGKTLGREAMERIVEVTGRDGSPQPYLWTVILKEGTGSREVDVAGGKIEAQRPLTRPPVSSAPIKLTDLNLDSSGAFDATETQARKVHLRFDSLNYTLRVSETTGKPAWKLELFDKEGSGIGTIRLAAHDGSTLSTDGRLASNPTGTAPRTNVYPTPAAPPVERPVSTPRVAVQTPPPYRPLPPRTTEPPARTSTTTTTTTVQTLPPPQEEPNETVVTETIVHDSDEGGLFTRTGRTVDKTTKKVENSLRRAGVSVQRFFTGHIGDDNIKETVEERERAD